MSWNTSSYCIYFLFFRQIRYGSLLNLLQDIRHAVKASAGLKSNKASSSSMLRSELSHSEQTDLD